MEICQKLNLCGKKWSESLKIKLIENDEILTEHAKSPNF